jgi:hypothetical protein
MWPPPQKQVRRQGPACLLEMCRQGWSALVRQDCHAPFSLYHDSHIGGMRCMQLTCHLTCHKVWRLCVVQCAGTTTGQAAGRDASRAAEGGGPPCSCAAEGQHHSRRPDRFSGRAHLTCTCAGRLAHHQHCADIAHAALHAGWHVLQACRSDCRHHGHGCGIPKRCVQLDAHQVWAGQQRWVLQRVGRLPGAAQPADVRDKRDFRSASTPPRNGCHRSSPYYHHSWSSIASLVGFKTCSHMVCCAGLTAVGGMVLVGGGVLPSTTAQTLAATAVAAVRLQPCFQLLLSCRLCTRRAMHDTGHG